MSWNSGTFTRAGGTQRCEDEFIANDDINFAPMDADFNDLTTGINLCFPADGSKTATGNWDLGGNGLLNLASVTGNVAFAGNPTIAGTLTVTGIATLNGGAGVTGDIIHTGNTTQIGSTAITGDLAVTGTITNDLMPTSGIFTPTIQGDSTAGTLLYFGQDGNYTKIGNLVFFTLSITGTWSVPAAGGLEVYGLPFSIAEPGLVEGRNADTNTVPLTGQLDIDHIKIEQRPTSLTITAYEYSDLDAALLNLEISGWYIAT